MRAVCNPFNRRLRRNDPIERRTEHGLSRAIRNQASLVRIGFSEELICRSVIDGGFPFADLRVSIRFRMNFPVSHDETLDANLILFEPCKGQVAA